MDRSPDLTDRDPRRKMWNFLSPIALFASASVGGYQNELVPVAIQMDYTPGSVLKKYLVYQMFLQYKIGIALIQFVNVHKPRGCL